MRKKEEEEERNSEYKKGLWTVEEDQILMDYVKIHGKGNWNRIAKKTGLKRCGKSCRLRWMNYLSPNVKKGDFTDQEEDLIIRLHKLLGNRWSLIAKRVPGRTDNQVKNYWNTHLRKKLGIKGERIISKSIINNGNDDQSNLPNRTEVPEERLLNINEERLNEGLIYDKFQLLPNINIQKIGPTIEGGEDNYMSSLWVHHDDDFDLMMDFIDGHCF